MSAAKHVRAGDGQRVWILGDLVRTLVSCDDTGGQFLLSETITAPGGGPPPHVHHNEDEVFYILDGDFDFLINDKVVAAPPGSLVFGPRDVPHQFRCKGPNRGRFLVWVQPGGFERFFADIAVPAPDPQTPPAVEQATIDRLMAACPKFGLEMLPHHRETGRLPALSAPPATKTIGGSVRILCDGQTSGGTLTVAETIAEPGVALPSHLHPDHDEIFYFLDGQFDVLLGMSRLTARAGDAVFVPRGTVHTIRSIGVGRLLSYHTPSAFEHFVHECATPSAQAGGDASSINAIMQKYGMQPATISHPA